MSKELLFLSTIEPRFLCQICECVLKKADQSSCGCRFCDECTKSHPLTTKGCPVKTCGSLLDWKTGLFSDNAISREIKELDVQCPLCKMLCKMEDVMEHLERCQGDGFGELVEESRQGKEVYEWRIHNFNKILEEARNHCSRSYFQGPICTKLGYWIEFIIYPNGKGISRDKDISLFYRIIKGDKDTVVHCDCNMQVAFAIASKTGLVHKIKVPPDRMSNMGQQRQDEEKGVSDFLPIAEVGQYLDGNGIRIRVSMLPSQ